MHACMHVHVHVHVCMYVAYESLEAQEEARLVTGLLQTLDTALGLGEDAPVDDHVHAHVHVQVRVVCTCTCARDVCMCVCMHVYAHACVCACVAHDTAPRARFELRLAEGAVYAGMHAHACICTCMHAYACT